MFVDVVEIKWDGKWRQGNITEIKYDELDLGIKLENFSSIKGKNITPQSSIYSLNNSHRELDTIFKA